MATDTIQLDSVALPMPHSGGSSIALHQTPSLPNSLTSILLVSLLLLQCQHLFGDNGIAVINGLILYILSMYKLQ